MKRAAPRAAAKKADATEIARLTTALRAAEAERDQALAGAALAGERQAATFEILGVISSSPAELDPVFDTILAKALGLCQAEMGHVYRCDGDRLHRVAMRGATPAHAEWMRTHPENTAGHKFVLDMARREKRPFEVPDLKRHATYAAGDPTVVAAVDLGGTRTLLWVPMLKEDEVVGLMAIYRREVRSFEQKHLDLLAGFARQAVIAIENARLLGEIKEALANQTASAEVLRTIAGTPAEAERALDTIAEVAARRFDAASVNVLRLDGNVLRHAASFGRLADGMRASVPEIAIDPGSVSGVALLERRQIAFDNIADPELVRRFPATMAAAAKIAPNGGSQVVTPLLREGQAVGAIVALRDVVRPFTEKELAQLRNFADQAVIAIENARLLTELRDSLDRQTATADILRVIASTPGDPTQALQTIAETAARIFGASSVGIRRLEGDTLRFVAAAGPSSTAIRGAVPEIQLKARSLPGTIIRENRIVHIPDVENVDPALADSPGLPAARAAGTRTVAGVPLRREGEAIGALVAYRDRLAPFTADELALLQSFADQAVIAIENARLLAELRERTNDLGQRQAELRVTFDNMGDGVVMFDGELRLAAWNRNLQEILDLPDAFFAAPRTYRDYISYLIARGEFGAVDLDEEMRRYVESTDRERRVERTRPDGRVLEVRVNPVPGGGFVAIYGDITERKKAEAQVRAARDAAEATLRELRAAQANLIQAEKMASLGQLTAGIAHEIKNPLNFVNNFAGLSVELLAELKVATAPAMAALDDDKRGEMDEVLAMLTGNLEKIAAHGKRADGIVKSMLAHSRGGSGERQEVNLNGLVEEALNLAYHGARAQDKEFNITLERDYGEGIAPLEMVPQDVTRVFLNLFGNGFYAASKRRCASGDAAFRAVLRVTTREDAGHVVVIVRDNGIGIPPAVKEKLFQPFFTTKPTGEGTGLGLSISYEIVTRQHGGTIEVESEAGAFSQFTVRLPRRFAAPGAAQRLGGGS